MSKSKLSSVLVFTVVIFLAVAIVSGLYFFNIKKNEDYQNQLHFRELNSVASEVKSGYMQFVRISKVLIGLQPESKPENSPCDENQSGNCSQKILNLQTGSYVYETQENQEVDSVINRARQSRALRNIIIKPLKIKDFNIPESQDFKAFIKDLESRVPAYFSLSNNEINYVWELPKIPSGCEDQKCYPPIIAGNIPTSDLIPERVLSFPLILFADQNGIVKTSKSFYENSTEAADLEFTSIRNILAALHNKQKVEGVDKPVLPTYSGSIDKEIGSIQYRIFIQPLNISDASDNSDTHFLVGFVPLNEFRLSNLSINPSAGLWIMIALLSLTAIIPILKLRFSTAQEHFTRSDINLFFTGCFLLLGLFSITITHQFFYSYLKSSTLIQSQGLFKDIQEDFKTEVDKVISLRSEKVFSNTLAHDNRQTCEISEVNPDISRGFPDGTKIVSENCINDNLRYELSLAMYGHVDVAAFAESAFTLNSAGQIPIRLGYQDEREPIQRISKETFNFTDFSLSHREYFQKAITCDLWSSNPIYEADCDAKDSFYIQRIKNVSDGRLSTQFAFADYQNRDVVAKHNREVKSISIKLRTFFNRVLPKNFGYAVFDNNGEVLYHSNEERSLAENIVVETNNNSSINKLISAESNNNSMSFDVTYRNATHTFVSGRIHDIVPWKLVVFYDSTYLESTSLWTFLLAIFLFVQILLILFLWSRYATNQHSWARLISFCPDRQRSYSNCGMFMFAGILLCLSSMGVIVDLSARLAIWLALLAYYIFTFNKIFGEKAQQAQLLTHPMMPFATLSFLFAIHFFSTVSWQSFTFDNVLSIGFAIFGVVFFALAYAGFKKPILLSAFNARIRESLLNSYHSAYRYTFRYVFYLSIFIWFFAMVPGVLIINAANQYLLNVQSLHQSEHLIKRESEHLLAIDNYIDLVGAEVTADSRVIRPLQGVDIKKASCTLLNCSLLPWIDNTPSGKKINLHVDPLFNQLIKTQSFGGSLSEELYQFSQLEEKQSFVTYNANRFFLSALTDKFVVVGILLVIMFSLTLLFVRRFIVHGIMGEHLPDTPTPQTAGVPIDIFLQKHLQTVGARLQILQPDQPKLLNHLKQRNDLFVLGDRTFDIAHIAKMRDEESKVDIVTWLIGLEEWTETNKLTKDIDHSPHLVLVLNNFEKLISNKQLRNQARSFIKELHDQHAISVILLCDVDVLIQFNDCVDISKEASKYTLPVDESLSWSLYLRRYTNFTMCYTESKASLQHDPSAYQVFLFETQGWPELKSKGQVLIETLLEEHENDNIEIAFNNKWKPAQIIQFFNEQCTAFYRYKWSLCTVDERLMLFQLAQDTIVNPANAKVLNSLVKRGYIYRNSGWFIVNESFKRFVVTAESEERFQSWLNSSKSNTWKVIRIPIIVTILVLLALVVVATGQSIQSILATATAALGLVSLLMRNLSSFKSVASPSVSQGDSQ